MILNEADGTEDSEWVAGCVETKKCGVDNDDLRLHSQPRLPGSVVGEASMREGGESNKITAVTVPW